MNINQLRLIKLLGGENMKLIREDTPNEILFTINGPKNFYMLLVHNLWDAQIRDVRVLFKKTYDNLANADYNNGQAQMLYKNEIYHLLFNDTTQKSIPRSTQPIQPQEGDLLVYIPQYKIIEGWD